jgi:site-specific recombinase XerD
MGDLNDPGKYKKKYKKARKRLEERDINEEDRKAIRSFVNDREANGGRNGRNLEDSSLEQYCTVLIRATELAQKPLTDFNGKNPEEGVYESDYTQFIRGVTEGTLPEAKDGGYSDEYVRSFRQVLKPFFRFIGKDFSEDISIGQPSKGKITEEDCFTSDETARMFQVADTRDSAIIALWLATGQRASAMCSIKLGDCTFTENRGRFKLNPEAVGLKGAKGLRPMLWASPYVKRWVNSHPTPEEEEAPLFCCKRNGANYSIGDPLSYEAMRRTVQRVCDNANIPKEKAQTHRFRHTAIRRMIRDELTEQQICFIVGWDEDSSHLSRYGSLKDETQTGDIEQKYGLKDEEDTDIGVSFENCPKCEAPFSELVNPSYCPECGLPLRHSAEETKKETEEDLYESKSETEGQEEAAVDKLKNLLEENPELLEELNQ